MGLPVHSLDHLDELCKRRIMSSVALLVYVKIMFIARLELAALFLSRIDVLTST